MNVEELKAFEPSWKQVPLPPTPLEVSGPNSPGFNPVDFGPSTITGEGSIDLPDLGTDPVEEPQSEGGSSTHPWMVTVALDEGSGNLIAAVVPDSLFFESLATTDDRAVSGYNKAEGAEFITEIGHHVCISYGLNDELTIDAPTLESVDLADLPLDGDFYTLAGEIPDYADTQYIPIAKVESVEEGVVTVMQLVRNHIRLGIVAVDGALIYQPIAS